jgi:hypothetical protein
MKTYMVLGALVAGLLALTAVAPGRASDRGAAGACEKSAALKKVFPRARAVSFSSRSAIQSIERRQTYFRGWCGSWWTSYCAFLGVRRTAVDPSTRRPSIDVSVTLYRTRRQALVAAFTETSDPDPGPCERRALAVGRRRGAHRRRDGLDRVRDS